MSEFFQKGVQLLRIYMAEKDHVEGLPMYEWIVQRAARDLMSGASVFRGIGGFCAGNPVLTPSLMRIAINQPIVVEIVDTPKQIEAFVRGIENIIPHGLMTVQDVSYRFYGINKKKGFKHG